MSTRFEPISLCLRCHRAIDKVWLVVAHNNACTWCGHPILPPEKFQAARAISRMSTGTKSFDARALVRTMIAEYEAKLTGAKPKGA